MEYIVQYLLLGSFAGLVAGLLGVGGGLIIVPVLVWLLSQQGVNQDIIVHLAVGWSLVAAAFVNVSTGFCVPSFISRIFFGKVVCD